MRKSRFEDEQIVAMLWETDRDAVPVVAKRHGVSEQTIYTWKKRFGSFKPDDVRRLKQFGQENARLKKLVAERDLETEVMKVARSTLGYHLAISSSNWSDKTGQVRTVIVPLGVV